MHNRSDLLQDCLIRSVRSKNSTVVVHFITRGQEER
jgi:hypothetical protein